jgi:CBS domain-containing protein
MKIRTVLSTKGTHAFTVGPERTLRDAASLLTHHGVQALVVVDDEGSPVGIISESDIVRAAAYEAAAFGRAGGDFMTSELIVGSPDDELRSVMQTMLDRRIHHLPIVEAGRLLGLVPLGVVVRVLLEFYQGQIDTLETQIIDG